MANQNAMKMTKKELLAKLIAENRSKLERSIKNDGAELVPASRLHLNVANPQKRLTGLVDLAISMLTTLVCDPIRVARDTNNILGGHRRFMSLTQVIGLPYMPVLWDSKEVRIAESTTFAMLNEQSRYFDPGNSLCAYVNTPKAKRAEFLENTNPSNRKAIMEVEAIFGFERLSELAAAGDRSPNVYKHVNYLRDVFMHYGLRPQTAPHVLGEWIIEFKLTNYLMTFRKEVKASRRMMTRQVAEGWHRSVLKHQHPDPAERKKASQLRLRQIS